MPALIHSAPYQLGYNILYSRGEDPARAAILFFHGGGWMNGDPMFCAPLWPALLAERVVCGTAELRTKFRDPKSTIYQCIEDAKVAAARFAKMFPVAPKFLCGASAGGALALLAVTKAYRGCVLFNPVLDLSKDGFVSKMTPEGTDESISPLHQVGKGRLPPTLILHGGLDDTVPLASSERYAALAPDTELIPFPHSGHGFAIRAPNVKRVTGLMLDFIDRTNARAEAPSALR